MNAERLSDRRNLSEEAYVAVRSLIVSGELAPGAHVTVKIFSDRFGLSPTPIRTAFARLAGDGLLEAQDRRGYFVPALDSDDLLDIYELREAVDAVASRRVAQLPDRTELVEHLHQLVEKMESAVGKGDLASYNELDVQFHGSIWSAANNHRLTTIANNLLGQLRAGNRISATAPGRLPIALREHAEIVAALEAGDAARADVATRRHVQQAKIALKALIT